MDHKHTASIYRLAEQHALFEHYWNLQNDRTNMRRLFPEQMIMS